MKDGFPTMGDVQRWIERRAQIERMLKSLKSEWVLLNKKLDAAKVFVDIKTGEPIPPPGAARREE